MTRESSRTLLWILALGAWSCSSEPNIPDAFLHPKSSDPPAMHADHDGPSVASGDSGTARFVKPLLATFDLGHVGDDLKFVDGFYRAPANEGFDAVLDRIAARLRAVGYGSKAGFELEILSRELDGDSWSNTTRGPVPAWTPLRARLALKTKSGERLLQHFDAPGDRDRVMLPIGAPSADVEGPIVVSLDGPMNGAVLVTEQALGRELLAQALERGAVAVLSSHLESYNVDPRGGGAERDALQFCSVPSGTPIAVAMISPAHAQAIRETLAADPEARLALQASVKLETRPLRTLVARILGRTDPEQAIVVASHLQEPGACDNASGAVGTCEAACELVGAIEKGGGKRPMRTLVFLWGDEMRESSIWLESTKLAPIAAISSDMAGESREKTGAIALLERGPDPAAITALPPDRHTPWGRTVVDPQSLSPNGLAVVARTAIFDVSAVETNWRTAEHPYEGGSDHDIFIARGIPAALFWHFTDFAYHTSLDRLELVDPSEIRRTTVALVSTALALADPQPTDLDRYLQSLNRELDLRVKAADEAGDPALAQRWKDWCNGARHWLRGQCLHLPPEQR